MATEIEIPDFDFTGFYYPQILEALIQYKRRNVPEITDESAFEPFIQFLRAVALVGHSNNVLIDLVANESTLPTAKLVETVRNMLRLIDFEMKAATPAQVDLVYELSKVFLASTVVVPAEAQVATVKQGNDPARFFEALTALTLTRTDEFTAVFGEEDGIFADYTAKANSAVTPADDWAPWATPAVKDSVYFGHAEAMWDLLRLTGLTTPAANIKGVWEYYDGNFRKTSPTSVVDNAGTLTIDLTSYLGAENRAGTMIRVQLNETTAFEDVESTWSGSANEVVTGLLGQSSPSVDPTDYTVGSDWEILDEVIDGLANFTLTNDVEFPLPQTLTRDWTLGTVNTIDAFWLRYRIVEVLGGTTSPVIQRARMDKGKQFVKRLGTQGRSQIDDPLGSSTGLANQSFEATKDYFIDGSMTITVDGEDWTQVDNFLASAPSDKHYRVERGENDRAFVFFGDGTAGRIPTIGVNNIKAAYRYGAENDGNVGALTATIDKSGLSFVSKVYNPRPATGWREAQGTTEESLELAKIEGPASLRTKEVALSPDDAVQLTKLFTDDAGARPFSRAKAFEEGFGPKTLELVVVAAGGGQATNDQLGALDEYFNGDSLAVPPLPKHFVANQEVTSVNYTAHPINVVATVYGRNIVKQEIVNRLQAVVQPEALKADGVTFEWEFGEEVAASRISHEIFETSEDIEKVVLTTPPGDTALQPRELPTLGTVTITVVET
jgi:hypothetical protein